MPPLQLRRLRGECCALIAALTALPVVAVAGDTLVDPTRPVTASSEAHHETGLRVEAILDRNGQRVAIVAGQLVRAGQRFSWGQVAEVTATGVRYVYEGRSRFIALEIPKVKVRRDEAASAASPGGPLRTSAARQEDVP